MPNIGDRWPARLAQGDYAWPGRSDREEIPLDWYIIERWGNEWEAFLEEAIANIAQASLPFGVHLPMEGDTFVEAQRESLIRWTRSDAWNRFRLQYGIPVTGASRVEIREAQERFLSVVAITAPAMLSDLAEQPLRLFVNAWLQKTVFTSDDLEKRDSLYSAPQELVDAVEIEVNAWAIRWNVTAGWWMSRAWDALSYWRYEIPRPLEWSSWWTSSRGWNEGYAPSSQSPAWYDWREENFGSPSPIPDQELMFYFSSFWQPWNETRNDATGRIRAHFSNLLDEYLDRIEQHVKDSGAVQVRSKREPDHFKWLVRYHVNRESFVTIANDVCRDRMTVTDAVKDLATFIRLPLRAPGRPGRPRHSK